MPIYHFVDTKAFIGWNGCVFRYFTAIWSIWFQLQHQIDLKKGMKIMVGTQTLTDEDIGTLRHNN